METEKLLRKARRIRDEGKVHIKKQTNKYTNADVEGDHNEYSVMIWFDESQHPFEAKCGCKWSILRHSGKWCSHIKALLSYIGKFKTRSEFRR